MDMINKMICGIFGFVSSMVCIMGYYPLVPALYSAVCTEYKTNLPLYIGMLLGMLLHMPVGAMVKYVFLMTLIGVVLHFIRWTKRPCTNMGKGVIAAASVIGIDTAALVVSADTGTDMFLGVCEAAAAAGASILLGYVIKLAGELQKIFMQRWEDNRPKAPETSGRILALADAFDGLSSAFLAMPEREHAAENAKELASGITEKLCADCDVCVLCPDKIRTMTELNEAWYKRLQENRRLIAGQLDAMALTIQDWGKEKNCIDKKSVFLMAKLAYEAGERGIVVKNVHVYEDLAKRKCVRATVSSKWGGGIPSRQYLRALERASGIKMRLCRDARTIITREADDITAYEETVFEMLTGSAGRTKEGASISGDNFAVFTLEEGEGFVCLSDGMGSGPAASRESDLAVDLMEKLLEAGFADKAAIQLMNSAMVLNGGDESYTTLDFARIDLYTGELSLTKIGAAASFLRRGGRVECLSAATLPAGADADCPGETIQRSLAHGDILVMATDGVLEYLHVKKPEEKVAGMISEIRTDNAAVLAGELLERILCFNGGCARDDMTIVVAGIWEK